MSSYRGFPAQRPGSTSRKSRQLQQAKSDTEQHKACACTGPQQDLQGTPPTKEGLLDHHHPQETSRRFPQGEHDGLYQGSEQLHAHLPQGADPSLGGWRQL